ncbi:2-hydroxyacyl-CoA dehydratase subunit D [Adlercreutzia sp. ZJ138]|uniref:2-hydroxyacyl-CoA dehydratase subunit D n=1 Tax=Adlercreutzia sp. ZJ138 TaxID=2709405 RepID=UPI0013EABEF4|nr:2-hydroxyacyl-CoA dehydratase family protein [Adlercreutzia sp. ZJ138]
MEKIDSSLFPKEAEEWVASGKMALGTVCCYLPEEIIHAAGILPIRVRATSALSDALGEVYYSSYSCPWARTTLEQLMTHPGYKKLSGVYSSNGCMQAQRIYDISEFYDEEGRDYHLLNCPRKIDEDAVDFYKVEMEDMIASVEKLASKTITDDMLRKSVEVFNESRRLIKRMYEMRAVEKPTISGTEALEWTLASVTLPKEEFNKRMAAFLEEAATREPIEGHDVHVMLVGSPTDDPAFVKAIEDAGCLVVTDVTCFGSRTMWEEVELEGDIRDNLARMYLQRPACPRMIDNQRIMMETISDMYKKSTAQGIVYARMMNCDPWGAMRQYFDEYFTQNGIPYVELEREQVNINAGQVGVRIGALVEMLEEGEE